MGSLVVLMGPTGAGKSVQGELLAKEYGAVHLSSGELLRRDPHALALMVDGQLVDADEVERVIGEAIAKVPDEKLVVMDGTPRTQHNVDWMERELPKLGRQLMKVILIDLDIETSLTRLGLRGRDDDAPKAIRAKYELFQNTTLPVAEYYRHLGLLVTVDGRGSIEEVHQEIVSSMDKGVLGQ